MELKTHIILVKLNSVLAPNNHEFALILDLDASSSPTAFFVEATQDIIVCVRNANQHPVYTLHQIGSHTSLNTSLTSHDYISPFHLALGCRCFRSTCAGRHHVRSCTCEHFVRRCGRLLDDLIRFGVVHLLALSLSAKRDEIPIALR